jgi:peptide deformylase
MEDNHLLKIYKYGDEILKIKASPVENLDGKIAQLVDQMIHTLHNTYSAIGLAAPQVGQSLRLSIIDISMGEKPDDQVVLINPEILETEGYETGDEGCLSFPGISMTINRAARIFLKNFDMNGKEIRKEIDGFLARVIQHELDHLNGTLIIDRISGLKRQLVKKEIKRLQKDGKW